jgi:hypothetical protein
MYVLEAYSAGLPHLEPGSRLHGEALDQIRWCLNWMTKNQPSRVASCPWDYGTQWGSKLGGLPFHLYVYSRCLPELGATATVADGEMHGILGTIRREDGSSLSQLDAFTMMSLAEKIRPGAVYRPFANNHRPRWGTRPAESAPDYAAVGGVTVPKSVQASDIVGDYYVGDGLGYNIHLHLGADASYDATWTGCLGVYGTAKGTWRLESASIAFSPNEETEMMKEYLTRLDVLDYLGELIMVDPKSSGYFLDRGPSPRVCFRKDRPESKPGE